MTVVISLRSWAIEEPVVGDTADAIRQAAATIVKQHPSVNHPDATLTLSRSDGTAEFTQPLADFLAGKPAPVSETPVTETPAS